jgi:hypothetical protein
MIGGLIVLVAFVASPPGKSSAQQDSPIVYFGEVDSKTDQIIMLNVTPCQNAKTLQRISPYKITGSGKASCSGGKQYTRVTVQESKENGPVENAADKKKIADTDKKKDADTDKKKIADTDKKKDADTDKKKDDDATSEPKR